MYISVVAVSLKKKFFQAEDGIRDTDRSRGLGDVYKRQSEEEAMKIPGFGNMMLSSFEIRDPDSISRQLGTITFWVDREELLRGVSLSGAWAVMQGEKVLHADYGQGKEMKLSLIHI